jgi:hypothetical protein
LATGWQQVSRKQSSRQAKISPTSHRFAALTRHDNPIEWFDPAGFPIVAPTGRGFPKRYVYLTTNDRISIDFQGGE